MEPSSLSQASSSRSNSWPQKRKSIATEEIVAIDLNLPPAPSKRAHDEPEVVDPQDENEAQKLVGLQNPQVSDGKDQPDQSLEPETNAEQPQNQEPNNNAQQVRTQSHQEVKVKACLECGATETPLWRRGPKGMKTLCNACGLRYWKQERVVSTKLTLKRS